jgi:hypothetical protein
VSGKYGEEAAYVLAPAKGGTAPRKDQRLAGTGTTEAHNTTALAVNAMATLQVGSVAVRATFTAAAGGAAQVASTDLQIGAGARFDWVVTPATKHVYIEAADGSAAYEAWAWTSGPGQGA